MNKDILKTLNLYSEKEGYNLAALLVSEQNNFRVIYHENIDYKITKESLKQLKLPDSKDAECYPICGEYKISLKSENEDKSPINNNNIN